MKKFSFSLSLSLCIVGLLLVGCKNELEITYQMSGDWYADYAAVDTLEDIDYSRIVQAYHFNGNGTGYWYKFMLPDDSEEPIDMLGGSFSYSTDDDGSFVILLDKETNGTERTRRLTYADGALTGSDADGDYTLRHATDSEMLWCRYWNETLNGGSNLVGLWLALEDYRDNTALRMQWAADDKMVVGSINANNQSTMLSVPVVSMADMTFIMNSYVSSLAQDRPVWAATGVDDVSVSYKDNNDASTFFPLPPSLTLQCTVPATYTTSMYGGDRQIINVPMVGYSATRGDTLQLQNLCAAVKVCLSNATESAVVLDEVVVSSDYYRLNGQIELPDFDGQIANIQPQTTTTKAQRTVSLTFAKEAKALFTIPNGGETRTVFVPVLPTGADNFTVEVRCHPVQAEGVADTTYSYSDKMTLPAMERNTTQSMEVTLRTENRE
ncbi:MAG: hypothetical protein IJT90_01430 [Bacteroidaceae bacterium]|nr:hypothetical protein [Bacteroidaceae bacterium]